MKKTVPLSLMMGICSASSAFAALPQSIRIGTDATYAPFSSKDAKGDFVGFDIDLGNELCSRIKVKCTGWQRFRLPDPVAEGQENRRYHLFVVDYGKTPTGNRLL